MQTIIERLRNAIGLDASSIGLGSIERAVNHRITASKAVNLQRYRQLLQESPVEFRALVDALVVPETWFFRDRGAFDAVAAQAKARILLAPLRYLCIPCATGEEPLSLAMTLLDAGVPPELFQIDAFDICERLVSHAARGVFGRNSFRGDSADFRTRYFRNTPEGSSIHPAVRNQVTFYQANLLDDASLPGSQIYDAIFCRNLLIYFDAEARLKAMEKITRLLPDDGLLCVAPAETALLLRNGFAPAGTPQSFAFQKLRNAAPLKLPLHASPRDFRVATQPIPRFSVEKPPQPVPPVAPAAKVDPTRPLTDAVRLADEGRFEEVSAICHADIDSRGPSADAYYLLALVSDASDHYEEAAAFYRKALYLDPQHRDALAHFSLLSDKLGDTAAAGALRRRALRIESNAA